MVIKTTTRTVNWLPGPCYNNRKDWIIEVIEKHTYAPNRQIYNIGGETFVMHPITAKELRAKLENEKIQSNQRGISFLPSSAQSPWDFLARF